MTQEMVRYYAERAAEYDRVYEMPSWRSDVATLHARIPAFFAGRRVFEVACGTGYWTQRLARTAAEVSATDVNEEMLVLARARELPNANVRFARRDAYAANPGDARFDGGYAGFWLSHVDLARMREFLTAFHSYLTPGAVVLMVDERQAPGRTQPASRTDVAGNRYEMRRLDNVARFEIVKNLFDPTHLAAVFAGYARDLVVEELERFWLLTYRTIEA